MKKLILVLAISLWSVVSMAQYRCEDFSYSSCQRLDTERRCAAIRHGCYNAKDNGFYDCRHLTTYDDCSGMTGYCAWTFWPTCVDKYNNN